MTTAIRSFVPTIAEFFAGFRAPEEVVERDPGAARECFEQMIHGHPGCESEAGAQMIMAMYPDQF